MTIYFLMLYFFIVACPLLLWLCGYLLNKNFTLRAHQVDVEPLRRACNFGDKFTPQEVIRLAALTVELLNRTSGQL